MKEFEPKRATVEVIVRVSPGGSFENAIRVERSKMVPMEPGELAGAIVDVAEVVRSEAIAEAQELAEARNELHRRHDFEDRAKRATAEPGS